MFRDIGNVGCPESAEPMSILRSARWLTLLVLLTAGCSKSPRPEASAAPAARAARVQIEVSTTPDVGDIPRLMAIDAMRARGYRVDTRAFADTTGTILALERGDLDFANVQNITAWTAIQRGTPLLQVIDDSVDPTILAARSSVAGCPDLQARRIGVGNLDGGKTVLLNRYLQRRCPGTAPNLLVVAGETNRLAGLLAGELDAAILDQDDLDGVAPARRQDLKALVVFADEFPGVTLDSFFTRRELARTYPATVRDFLHDMLEARRRIQDPQRLAEELVSRLGSTPDAAIKTAVSCIERRFWDLNGRYTPDAVQRDIDVMVEATGRVQGLHAGDVADLTFLDAVLGEIGRVDTRPRAE
jgi:ABC-type nitrate/sulfonate/bicarbonate transport system substrate-binding protein